MEVDVSAQIEGGPLEQQIAHVIDTVLVQLKTSVPTELLERAWKELNKQFPLLSHEFEQDFKRSTVC